MKILLIEDDLTIANFVINGMKQAGFVVEHAEEGRKGWQLAQNNSYDLGIFDIMLPNLNGLEIIKRVRENKIEMPIIILSAKRSLDDKVRGLQDGADDYLTKPFSFSELLARVQALLRRSNHDTQSTSLTVGELTIDLLARTAHRQDKKIDLQPKELALLEYLMRNVNHVVSKIMIMERVWDYNFDPQTNIVEARISNLRNKIDKGFEQQLIHTVRGLGYVLKDHND
ncbi:response regulator transcription factor [Thalassotalea fonticola]|uniref:Response regulator transcription factor n=1 Tax=Thalassotalea fonticola TaxID=3065649 RepID=A0ABZ0GJZ5_9GAMM|nr:response regulator transcription factor [Colwelliaceae bacterium S1-1]